MPFKHKKDLYESQKRYRIKVRGKLLDFLSDKSCIDCGETDPIVLDFDHINPDDKFKSISTMLGGHYSWESIATEIKKCEIRCSNCHRRKTYVQFECFGKTK